MYEFRNITLLIGLFIISYTEAYCQANKIAGTYSDWPDRNGPSRELLLYNVNDSTLYFYMEGCKGPPSYNSGSEDGIIKVKGDSGIYTSSDTTCILYFHFQEKSISVSSKERNFGCGYGNGVVPDGIYPRTSKKRPKYFIDRHGDTTYFSKYNPNTQIK